MPTATRAFSEYRSTQEFTFGGLSQLRIKESSLTLESVTVSIATDFDVYMDEIYNRECRVVNPLAILSGLPSSIHEEIAQMNKGSSVLASLASSSSIDRISRSVLEPEKLLYPPGPFVAGKLLEAMKAHDAVALATTRCHNNTPRERKIDNDEMTPKKAREIQRRLTLPSKIVYQKSLLDSILGDRLRPTIIVPRDQSSLVHLGNFKSLVQEGQFIESGSPDTGDSLSGYTVVGEIRQKPVKFKVVDSAMAIKRFSMADWSAVVCIVLTGKPWQFEHWPFQSMEEAMKAVDSFFFTYPETPLPPLVSQCNAKVLVIARAQRHSDIAIRKDFWERLSGYLARPALNRPKPVTKQSVRF